MINFLKFIMDILIFIGVFSFSLDICRLNSINKILTTLIIALFCCVVPILNVLVATICFVKLKYNNVSKDEYESYTIDTNKGRYIVNCMKVQK